MALTPRFPNELHTGGDDNDDDDDGKNVYFFTVIVCMFSILVVVGNFPVKLLCVVRANIIWRRTSHRSSVACCDRMVAGEELRLGGRQEKTQSETSTVRTDQVTKTPLASSSLRLPQSAEPEKVISRIACVGPSSSPQPHVVTSLHRA